MKRATIAVCLLAVMFFAFSLFLFQIRNIHAELQDAAEQISEAAAAGDWEQTSLAAERLGNLWNQRKGSLGRFLGHDQTDPLELSIARVIELTKQKNSSDLLVELAELSINISRIWSTEALSMENMF